MANSFKNTKFRRVTVLGNITVIFLGGLLIIAILNIVVSLFMVASPDAVIELEGGDAVEPAWAIIGLIALLELPLRLLCGISFLVWLHRAYKNLPVLGARNLKHTPGWAVGWWLIPFVNLFMPFKVVRELFAESDPSKRDEAIGPSSGPESFEIIGFWWGTFLASTFVFRISNAMAGNDTASPSKFFPAAYMTGHIFMATAAVLAAMIVRKVSSWQENTFNSSAMKGAFAPPPPPMFDGGQ